ncbi:MAG TPA: dihydroneopterin aldolase [Burkholderiales bacterium]|jgi:dihydroneopterin aldolase|nr:dihydroneopterin aldolase [Burkholderiales bacterium]
MSSSKPEVLERGKVALAPSRRIFLRNFETRISIGVHDFEKQARQRVVINVDLYLEPAGRIQRDHISETVDYDFLRREIAALADSAHFHLQETFCERILALCLARPGVTAARVSSEKPDVYPDCDAVGFEIFGTNR